MAWTQFEYSKDVEVKITRRDGESLAPAGDVIIKPSSRDYAVGETHDGGVLIHLPYDKNGCKLSVEFKGDLHTYRSNGREYTDLGGYEVGTEPINSLLIFASAFLKEDLIPPNEGVDIHYMKPGPINNNDWGSASILYFPPGIYWMNQAASGGISKYGENHIKLSPKTYWVYLAPGSYVKGAIEYSYQAGNFFATGHGVLSGEDYVYQANPTSFYQAIKSDYSSLRMWWHNEVTKGQKWTCVGPTINAPPFNTMDFNGDESKSVFISDYKQVGSFYFQTDGPQVYPNSVVENVFYHVNDDGIKAYYSDVEINNIIIWKINNDPVIQMGWAARNIKNIKINGLYVIHTRYFKTVDPKNNYVPSAIIGASPFYNEGQAVKPDFIISINISNVICEGICPALMQITPLQSFHIVIQNITFPDGLQRSALGIGQSLFPAAGITLKLLISNWTVKGNQVTMENFQSDSLGQFNIDASYWGQWQIVADEKNLTTYNLNSLNFKK